MWKQESTYEAMFSDPLLLISIQDPPLIDCWVEVKVKDLHLLTITYSLQIHVAQVHQNLQPVMDITVYTL